MFANHYLQQGEFLTREEKAERAHSFKHGKVRRSKLEQWTARLRRRPRGATQGHL